jgi:hypothetical protein
LIKINSFTPQIAIADGWSMAKAVSQRKAGKYADKEYQKEAELRRSEGPRKKVKPDKRERRKSFIGKMLMKNTNYFSQNCRQTVNKQAGAEVGVEAVQN